jgi:SecD/SecF fusion protein
MRNILPSKLVAFALLAVCALATHRLLASPADLGSFASIQAAAAQELRGESYLVLEVARDGLTQERVVALRDEVRTRLRNARIAYEELRAEGLTVQLRVRDDGYVEQAKAALADLLAPPSAGPGGAAPVAEVSFEEPEPGFLKYTLTDRGIDQRVTMAVDGSIAVIRKRLDELRLPAPEVDAQGTGRIVVRVGDVHDPARLVDVVSQRGRLTMQLVDQSMSAEEALAGRPPAGSSVLYGFGEPQLAFLVDDRVLLSGEHLVDAQAGADQATSQPVVSFRFDSEGARLFGELTQQNVGRALAVVLDSQVLMAPVIREPILGGTAQIAGNFTTQSANDIAILLRAGELPAPLNLIERRFSPVEP